MCNKMKVPYGLGLFCSIFVINCILTAAERVYDVRWYSPFLAGGGYSSEAISYVVPLSEFFLGPGSFGIVNFAEHQNRDFVHGLPSPLKDKLSDLLKQGNEQRRNRNGKFTIAICHSTPDVWVPSVFAGWDSLAPCPPPDATISIGRTMYETSDFPADWIPRLKRMSYIWVPTNFHRDILIEKHGFSQDKVVVVHQAVDTQFFSPPQQQKRGDETFRFLSIFKWEARKGWDILLKAFCLEFDPLADNVELVIKTSDFYLDEPIETKVKRLAEKENFEVEGKRFHILERDIKGTELPIFYASHDAYVTASRGEGWGRPIVEAMSMGLPVIATNFSGPTEFLNNQNGYPLKIDGLADIPKRTDGHKWAVPSVSHLRQLMRRLVEDPAESKAKGHAAREDMKRMFSLDVIASQVVGLLDESFESLIREEKEL